MIPQFSFRFAAVALAYSAVLCLAYFTPNVWAGWFAVIATAAVISIAIFQAFRNQNQWTLGFAVTSCATLITCLGFTIETRGVSGFKFDTDLRQSMSKFLLGDPIEESENRDVNRNPNEERAVHHLCDSFGIGSNYTARYFNLSRLVICIFSLLIGSFGGLTFKWLSIPRQKKLKPSHDSG